MLFSPRVSSSGRRYDNSPPPSQHVILQGPKKSGWLDQVRMRLTQLEVEAELGIMNCGGKI